MVEVIDINQRLRRFYILLLPFTFCVWPNFQNHYEQNVYQRFHIDICVFFGILLMCLEPSAWRLWLLKSSKIRIDTKIRITPILNLLCFFFLLVCHMINNVLNCSFHLFFLLINCYLSSGLDAFFSQLGRMNFMVRLCEL